MKEIIKDLLRGERPENYKDFLFEMQNQLIASGYVEGMTKESREAFTYRFMQLHEFFTQLSKQKETVVNL